MAQTGCGWGWVAGSVRRAVAVAPAGSLTKTPLPGRLRTSPSAASRSYAATTVLRETSSRSASSRDDGSGSATGSRPARMPARSWR